MKNRPILIVLGAGVGLMCILATLARLHRPSPVVGMAPVAAGTPMPDPFITPVSPSFPAPRLADRPADDVPVVQPPPQTQPIERTKANAAPRPRPAGKFSDVVAQEELTPQKVARVALGYVGADPVAEQVWEAAINSPNFSPDERKDLIEDLNEDGFDDPKNLTPADLPLIVSRLQLIENLAPQAADEVNAAAFAEAYKDLAIMFAKLTR